jgi:hypothetical protein
MNQIGGPKVRRLCSSFAFLGLAALGTVLLGLSGCVSADDDDAAIGTPTAAVEGLVAAPGPPRPSPSLVAPTAAPSTSLRLATYTAPTVSVRPSLSPVEIDQDAARLSAAMTAEVADTMHLSPPRQQALIALGQQMAEQDHFFIRQPQLVLIVDRAPRGQLLAMALARPDSDWTILGASRVSTGKPGRLQHFKTPVGVLLNDGSEIGYRAQGTFNQNHIRGLGVKGMRVWDFGWQTTEDWRTPGAVASVRLEMHATDPTFLEERLGRPDSEACIRIPDRFNQFLDRFGLIDAQLTALAPTSRAVAALLPTDVTPSLLAGDKVVVVDTSEPNATPSNPAMAEEMERHFADWLASRAPSLTTQEPATAQVEIAVTGSGTKSSSRTPDRSSRREASGGSFRAASLKSESNER